MAKVVLVTGSQGQLGSQLKSLISNSTQYKWLFTDMSELDISKRDQVNDYFGDHAVDVCLNCAAYTAVDKAEDEPGIARLINAEAVKYLADACFANHALLIHLSTDYVFDGKKASPYIENDAVNPISNYARSKALGERVLGLHNVSSIILRSSWLYSQYGHNFVKTIIRLASERTQLKIVNDQIGSPTWAGDLAEVMLRFVEKAPSPIKETYHYSNVGAVSWYEFAKEIVKMMELDCKILPISTFEFPAKAKRPSYSVMDTSKIRQHLGIMIPDWKESLEKCLVDLNQNEIN